MRRLMFLLVIVMLASAAFAQRSATLSGIIKTEQDLPEGTRVAIHVVDKDNVWGEEVGSVVPALGTFTIAADPVPGLKLSELRSGAVLLPGLQNEYRVSPEGVSFALGRVNMYVDKNANEVFDRVTDPWFIGVPSLESPVGFFALIYVDRDATLSGDGADLDLKQGWNVFSVRFPSDKPVYAIQATVEDIVLDVFLP